MTPQAERGSYHHGDLRNALVAEALRLIAARGVEAFSLREAARGLGVSPTAAYRHFADRSALLRAVAQEGLSRLALAMEKARARAPGAPGSAAQAAGALAALGEAYVEFAVHHTAHFRVMFGPWACGAGVAGPEPFGQLVAALDGLVAAGAVPAAARAGAEVVAWSAVHGLATLLTEAVLPLGPAERKVAERRLTRAVLRGLGADPDLLGGGAPADGGAVAATRRRRR